MHAARWPIVAALVAAAGAQSFAFDEAGRSKVATDAMRLAPPALARQISRHRDMLIKGAEAAPPADLSEANQKLSQAMAGVVTMINTHQPFREISESLGGIAGLLTVLNNPLWPADRRDAERFARFFGDRMNRFPLVFYGYGELPSGSRLEPGDVSGFVDRIRARYVKDLETLRAAYHPPGGGPILVSDFDDRSVPFAIASISYSHAVNDTAEAWIQIWRQANGSLKGTPYLKPQAARRKS